MKPRLKIIAASLLTASFASGASAADFPMVFGPSGGGPGIFSGGPGGGWYLRGDLSGQWRQTGGAETSAAITTPTNNKVKSALGGGLGFGYRADFLRGDLTVDYALPADYKGTTVTTDDTMARLQMTTVLANAYFDLGTWAGITPYIGAGAGAGFAKTTQFTRAAPLYTGADSVLQTRFAYAGMAGLAYKVAPNLQIDLGYRYLNYGNIKIATETLGDTKLKNVSAHEVRVGLRWSFDDLPLR